ncbi:protein of unknown function (DUF3328) domain containing protein [Naviculisporaceae sp. PSN 640]
MAFERAGGRRDGQNAEYHLITTAQSSENSDIKLEDGSGAVLRQRLGVSFFAKVYLAVVHIVIVILICLLFLHDRLQGLISGHVMPFDGRTWSPVQKHVTFTTVSNAGLLTQNYDKGDEPSVFSGPPTPEQDRAWDELLKPMFFAATREEMTRAGETFESNNTTEIVGADGDEYLAALGVYHELHCLRKIRRRLFRDDPASRHRRDTPGDSGMKTFNEKDEDFQRNHLYHCIDTIRASLMCQANTAMLSFQWSSEIRNKAFPKTNSRSVCVDWTSIVKWSLERMVDANHLPVNWPFPSKQQGSK